MKKFSMVLIITLLLTLGICPTAFAEENSTSKIFKAIDKADIQIESLIQAAIQEGNELQNQYQIDIADLNNKQDADEIAKLKEEYNQDLDKLIEKLMNTTNNIANKTVIIADKNDITIDCYYVKVKIADRIIWVDPCRVRSY
jgi:esterase/lipase